MAAHAPLVSAPKLPTATRAVASQVGIRAREPLIPAESPSHARCAVARRLALFTHRCGGSAGFARGRTVFPFHPPAARPTDSWTRSKSARKPCDGQRRALRVVKKRASFAPLGLIISAESDRHHAGFHPRGDRYPVPGDERA